MHFNVSIMLCKAELTCWHHTVISRPALLADIILLSWLCSLSSRADSLALYCHLTSCFARWHHTATRALLCLLASYCYLVLCFLSSRADSLALYCHLALCSARWHHTAI